MVGRAIEPPRPWLITISISEPKFAAGDSGRPAYDVSGNWVDYEAAVSGALQLVPKGPSLAALADGYARMVDDGLLLDDSEPFDALMKCCQAIADRANQRD